MRSFGLVGLSLLSLGLVAHFINSLSPLPRGRSFGGREDATSLVVAQKLHFFEQAKDDYDLLIVGSSRLMAGLIPDRIESELQARGVNLKSFNLAVNAMLPHEADALLQRVLEMNPKRLRWVVVELFYWTGNLPKALRLRPRTVYWHNLENTLAATRSAVLYTRKTPIKKFKLVTDHFLHLGAHLTALGQGPQAARNILAGGKEDISIPSWLAESRGYKQPAWGRKALLEHLDDYYTKLERLERVSARSGGNLDRYNVKEISAQQQRISRHGATALYLIPPSLNPSPALDLLAEHEVISNLMAFNNPLEYPELYEVEHRWDPDHLSTKGAEILSALFAAQLADLLQKAAPIEQ